MIGSERDRRQRFERDIFLRVLRTCGMVVLEEHRFHPTRRWRFDVSIPAVKLAIEIEGLHGRHQMIGGFLGDMEKYNEAVIQGWRVLRFTTKEIADGTALAVIERAGVKIPA